MNNIERYTETKLGNYLNDTWLLNLHILKNKSDEPVSKDTEDFIINKYLSQLENECLSDEFDYLKIGFAFLHFGRRGVSLNIWHIGEWNCTYEIFCCNWYCYGRDIGNMELLDKTEPKICHYELLIANKEFESIMRIIKLIKSKNEFITSFIKVHN